MKYLALWVFLLFAVMVVGAQNSGGVVITIVSPSTGANLMGVLSVDVTVSAPVTSLTAKLNRAGVLEPVATSAMTKSGNDHYIAIFTLPTVTASEPYSVTVSDGTVAAIRAFNVAPSSPGPVDPQPPTDLHAQIIALIQALPIQQDANTKLLLTRINAIASQVSPLPTPTGIPCAVVTGTSVYADGSWKVTLKCPSTMAPAPPAKGSTVAVFGTSAAPMVK